MALPLHIFEPRYRVMIARCLDEKLEFGMILAANNNIATMGCTAEIVRKIRDYPDGRLDIATEGRAVFCLTELLDEKDYYEGVVEYVTDEPSSLDASKRAKLVAAFEQAHEFLFGQPWMQGPTEDEATYRMAALLPVELEKAAGASRVPVGKPPQGYGPKLDRRAPSRSSRNGSRRASAPAATVTR